MLTLNYHSFGEGKPVVILHGLFGSARNWQSIAKSLSESYQVITVDLHNHGHSPHINSMTYPEMAEDIALLIQSLKLDHPAIIGHSMGGKVAMTLALMHANQLRGQVIVDIAPVSYRHKFSGIISAMKAVTSIELANRTMAEERLAKQIKDPMLVAFLMQNLIRSEHGFKWRINLQQIENQLADIGSFPDMLKGKQSRVPSLFLGGANSAYIAARHNQTIFDYFPAAEIKMIEGAGHWLHVEKPKAFLAEINNFLRYL